MSDIAGAYSKVQAEETSFRSSISTDLIKKIGATINLAITGASPLTLGSIECSILTEAQFQGLRNTGWVLCDGRNIIGSQLNILTGATSIPDNRGRINRGKAYASGNDPNGNPSVGATFTDTYALHNHSGSLSSSDAIVTSNNTVALTINPGGNNPGVFPTGISGGIIVAINAFGTNESRPNCVTVNFFIRIN
jgi:hypothetical protein